LDDAGFQRGAWRQRVEARMRAKIGYLTLVAVLAVGVLGPQYIVKYVVGPRSNASTSTSMVAVSAMVGASCIVGSTPLLFGNYSGGAVSQTAAATVLCTNGTPYTIGLDNGTGSGATVVTRLMTGPNNQTLSYGVYSDAAHTTAWGSSAGTNTVTGSGTGTVQTIPVYGQISPSQSPTPGNYTDTITVTLTY